MAPTNDTDFTGCSTDIDEAVVISGFLVRRPVCT